eukprot:gene29927-37348_t
MITIESRCLEEFRRGITLQEADPLNHNQGPPLCTLCKVHPAAVTAVEPSTVAVLPYSYLDMLREGQRLAVWRFLIEAGRQMLERHRGSMAGPHQEAGPAVDLPPGLTPVISPLLSADERSPEMLRQAEAVQHLDYCRQYNELWTGLTRGDILDLARWFKVLHVLEGDKIARVGEAVTFVGVVTTGFALEEDEDGAQHRVPGSLFGESELFCAGISRETFTRPNLASFRQHDEGNRPKRDWRDFDVKQDMDVAARQEQIRTVAAALSAAQVEQIRTVAAALSAAQRTGRYWHGLRGQEMDVLARVAAVREGFKAGEVVYERGQAGGGLTPGFVVVGVGQEQALTKLMTMAVKKSMETLRSRTQEIM